MKDINFNFNKKLITSELFSFIITENCPFQCAHCMRGDRRPISISEEVIDAVLSQIQLVGTIHLGGGEPLMNIKKVIYLINQLYKFGITPEYINVITNGSIAPHKFEEFVDAVKGKFDINIMISNDYYHKQERLRLYGEDNILKTFKEYKNILSNYGFKNNIRIEEYEEFENGKGVSAIGKGANISGARICNREFKFYRNVQLLNTFIIGELQVNPNGIICPAFDMSWEERDLHYGQKYNILNKSLERILKF